MTPLLIDEAVRMILARRVQPLLILLVAATTCGVLLVATTDSLQAERDVLGLVDDLGTRTIILTDVDGGGGMTPAAVGRIRALSSVESVYGVGPAVDGRNAALGAASVPVPVRTIFGDIGYALGAEALTVPPDLAAVATPATLRAAGMRATGGVLDLEGSKKLTVAGVVDPSGVSDRLDGTFVAITSDDHAAVREIHVLARSPSQVADLATVAVELATPNRPEALAVETSTELAELRQGIAGELGEFGRRLLLLVFGATVVIVGVAAYSSVAGRRRDFGRRRALGATRGMVAVLILTGASLPAAAGALVGAVGGTLAVQHTTGSLPEASFTVAVAVLTVIAGCLGSVPPAVMIALSDPQAELRIP